MHRIGLQSVVVMSFLALPVCAQAAGDSGVNPGNLGQAIATIIIFLLLLVVLGKWAWKPIVAQLQQREQAIAASIERAEKREIDAQTLISDYEARMEQVQIEARELLEKTRKESARTRDEMIETARQEAAESVKSAQESIDQARREAMRDLYDETARLAADIAGQVIQKGLSEEEHQRLVQESLQQIGQQAGDDSR
ncbi:MAG: F0F1 ATP synthase subunit B [Planctomycetota bacterium]